MLGEKDSRTVSSEGERTRPSAIRDVEVIKLHNVLTRSGTLTEVFRSTWFKDIKLEQVNWVEMNSNGVTDWHCHYRQTDRLIGLNGIIKLCLFDARPNSTTKGVAEIFRMGIVSPTLVIVPKGVWHGLRNESGQQAGYLNVIDQLYDHSDPDNFRLPFDSRDIPVAL